ncbi:MAG: methyltransferase domain-containing protein [Candidatus Staskawiczbacteria bacterium]|nr:methyltransferase domain-containing protein [Candidatus Staskawiczbacteria bacterium]
MMRYFKRFFNWAYVRLFLDRTVVESLSEHYHLSKKEVVWLLKNGGRINNDFWLMLNPKTDEEKNRFYEITPFYNFELSLWHMTRYQKRFRKAVLGIAKGRVLDFGGGIGDMSLLLAKNGFSVEYADVSGNTYNYAKWQFAKAGLSVAMTDLSSGKVSGRYDTIICIDVIEHLPNAKEVLKSLADSLNSGGTMVVTNLTVSQESSKYHPMHEDAGIDEEYIKSLGLTLSEKSWLLIKQ